MALLEVNPKSPAGRGFIMFCLLSNLVLSILIVLLNKWVYDRVGFPNLTLTCIHFLMTALGLVIASRFLRLFKVKRLPLLKMVPLSAAFCGYVVFTNLSLDYNTVGAYQIIKTLTMPVIMSIQTYFYGHQFSSPVKLTLIPIIAGVFLNSLFDLKFNALGVFFALVGVIVTAIYQILIAEQQKQFQVNSMQLLYYQAPMSALWLLVIIPFVEPPGDHLLKPWSSADWGLVLLSGFVALLINISIYAVIGNTSAMTYNVSGQVKFGLTLVGGYLLFQDPVQVLQLLGILITWSGVASYTVIRLREERASRELPVVQKRTPLI